MKEKRERDGKDDVRGREEGRKDRKGKLRREGR